MAAQSRATKDTTLGIVSLVFGIVSLVGVLMIGQASFEWIPSFDPADWLRVVTGWMMPIGFIGALTTGVPAIRLKSGRAMAIAGIAIGVIAIGIFVVMIVTHPY